MIFRRFRLKLDRSAPLRFCRLWCAALHLRSAVVTAYAMLISSANHSAPVLSVAPHITRTFWSWSSARGVLRLLRPWALSSASAGVVACGQLFAAAGGSYLALDYFPNLHWSHHEPFMQAAILHVDIFIIPIEPRSLLNSLRVCISKSILEHLELCFYPSLFYSR